MGNWRPTVRVLWLVQFLTTLAMNLGLVFVPFYLADDPVLRVEDDSARLVYTGLILGGPFVTTILFTPLWGWVADRTGPKRQVVRACFGLGATQLLMAAAQSPDQLVAIRLLQGMVSGVLAATLGLVAVVTPRVRQGRAMALLHSATPAGQILGPLLGVLVAGAFGFRATYVLLGSLIVGTGILSAFLLRQDGFVPTTSPNPFASLGESLQRALAQPVLRVAMGILVGGQFAFALAQSVFAIYAGKLIDGWVTDVGARPAWWNSGMGFTAIAMAVTGLANVFSSCWWGRLHDRQVPFLTPLGACLLAASMVLLVAWPPWWVVLTARIGIGVGVGAVVALQFAVIAQRTLPEERGQLMGLATALTNLGNLGGFILGGVLATWWTEAGNFAFAASMYVLVMLAALRLELSARQTPTQTSELFACTLGETGPS